MEDMLRQVAAIREQLGWFDRSEMGRLALVGPDRYTWLQGMVSADVRLLQSGERRRLLSCLLDPTGHILAELTLIDIPEENVIAKQIQQGGFILVETPPGAAASVAEQLSRYLIMEDAEIVDVSDRTRCISIQGAEIDRIRPELDAHIAETLAVDADHTGSGGVDLYSLADEASSLIETVRRIAGVEVGPLELEVLRIEAGIPKYGADMDASTLAPEAGLMQTHISLTKGCYVGQEIVARIDSRGHTNRALTGLVLHGDGLPTPGEKLSAAPDGTAEVGWITSIAPFSPAAGGAPVALGYVRHEHRAPGTVLTIGSGAPPRTAEVVLLPLNRNPAS